MHTVPRRHSVSHAVVTATTSEIPDNARLTVDDMASHYISQSSIRVALRRNMALALACSGHETSTRPVLRATASLMAFRRSRTLPFRTKIALPATLDGDQSTFQNVPEAFQNLGVLGSLMRIPLRQDPALGLDGSYSSSYETRTVLSVALPFASLPSP